MGGSTTNSALPYKQGDRLIYIYERGPVTDFISLSDAEYKAHPERYRHGIVVRRDMALDYANKLATNDGYDLVEDVDTGAYSYRKKLPAGRKYIALSNGTYVDVAEDQKVNPQASLFTSKYGQSIARDLTTHGTMSANDSTFVSGFDIGPVGFPAKGSKGEAIYDENGENYVQGAILTGSDGNDYYMSRSREDQGNGTTKSKLHLYKVAYAR